MKPTNLAGSAPSPPREERAGERRQSSRLLPFVGRSDTPKRRGLPPDDPAGPPPPSLKTRVGERKLFTGGIAPVQGAAGVVEDVPFGFLKMLDVLFMSPCMA